MGGLVAKSNLECQREYAARMKAAGHVRVNFGYIPLMWVRPLRKLARSHGGTKPFVEKLLKEAGLL